VPANPKSLPQDSCVFLSSASHSCVQSVGVTNSITTPNCACLGACPAPPRVLLPPTPAWPFISSVIFHFVFTLSPCMQVLFGMGTVNEHYLGIGLSPASYSVSKSESEPQPTPWFLCSGTFTFRVTPGLNCFLSHELSFLGRIMFKIEINWHSSGGWVMNMICAVRKFWVGVAESLCISVTHRANSSGKVWEPK